MPRNKKDESLRKRQGERLTKLLIDNYGKHGEHPKTKDFKIALQLYGEIISSPTISRICKGIDPIETYIKAFSAVLGVREEYLLCIDDYPHEDDRKQSIIRDYWTQWHNDASDRVRIVASVVAMLESRSIQTIYETKEGYQIRKIEGQYSAYNANESYLLSEDQFYTWLDTFAVNIRISEDSWIHLNKVYVVAPDHNVIELTINDYMKMVYDINDEITHRIHSWFSLYSYNISDTWDQSFFEVDTKKTATKETSDSL